MRIALFHNYYQTPGGEDQMFELECRALAARGHQVFPFSLHNSKVFPQSNSIERAKLAWESVHNEQSYKAIKNFLCNHNVDIGHVHNWFPLLSPAIYAAHKELKIPVVQTLHNYRLGCANGTFRRNGMDCRACMTGSRNNALLHRCYKKSLCGTFTWKRIVDSGWRNGIFRNDVDAYIAPSREILETHTQMGIPEDKIRIIPNACDDLLQNEELTTPDARNGGLFLGRLTKEKGVDTLIEAWKGLEAPLNIAGSGPDEKSFKQSAESNDNIKFLGQIDRSRVKQQLKDAAFLVFPSKWAEPFGLGIIEAMAAGRPVIASSAGAPSQIIAQGVNGLIVPPDDPAALAQAIKSLIDKPDHLKHMGQAARETYKLIYQPDSHARLLESLYQERISANAKKTQCA